MRCNTMITALGVVLLLVGDAQAGSTTATWTGGTGSWRDFGVWNSSFSSFEMFGSIHGWEFDDLAVTDPDIIIDGPASHVSYDQNTEDVITGGNRDFRIRPQSSGIAGKMTISGGASFTMETNDDADPDGQWMQFNGELLTVTGSGSLLRRGFGGSGLGGNESAGVLMFRGIRSEDTGTVNILLQDGGTLENAGGQITFGWFGRDNLDSTVNMTIDGGHLKSSGGANWDHLGGILGGAGNPSLGFHRGWDPTANGGAGGITDEDYSINFTKHGGTATVDGAGILVIQQIGPDGAADFDIPSLLTPVTYQQLWSGLDRGTAGASIEDIPAGMLQSHGSSAGAFGDSFVVNGSAGSDNYKLTSIQGAMAGGSNPGDINGDFATDAADAGTMFSNWNDVDIDLALTASQGDINSAPNGDGLVDAADAGVMFAAFTGDPPPADPGSITAQYISATGNIIVDVNNVINWYIEGPMTGHTDAIQTLPLGGGLVTDNDNRVGETALSSFSYFAHLGDIAEAGLNPGAFTLFWNAGLGTPVESMRLPEPASIALVALGLCGVLASRRRNLV